jgi:hypothetical protein
MDKQTAIQTAARELLEHGGPSFRTDAETPMKEFRAALDTGATCDEIAAEMRRQRRT